MSKLSDRLYEFGPYRLDAVKRVLLRDGQSVPVTSKAFDTLLLLVEHSGQVLQKDELMKALWPDTIVEENNLTQQISMLRKTLGERAHEHRYVVTVPGRGYSFVAHVREIQADETPLKLEEHTGAEVVIDAEEEKREEEPAKPPEKIDLPAVASPARHRWNKSLTLVALFALLFGLGLASSYHWIDGRAKRDESRAYGRSIAVLPFKDLSTRSSDNSLGLGITDTLIARLSNIRQISVRPTSAVIKYAGEDHEALAAGRELGVDSVLEGTVQRSGDHVRVTVQLVSARDGSPVWAQSFDEPFTDVFAMQDSISDQIARAMMMQLNVR